MITPDQLLACVRQSVGAIDTPRFFESERGYQGMLVTLLWNRLDLPDKTIVEQEYQKRALVHGLTIRPDIVVHEPFDAERHKARTDGNLAVIELKLKATPAEAVEDFKSIASMLKVLQYPLGIFINIGGLDTYANLVPNNIRKQVVCFAVALIDGVPVVAEEKK